MSPVINHAETDVVVCGLGHMGGPIAAEFTAADYSVVGIEKGPFWDFATDWHQDNKDDVWAIAVERNSTIRFKFQRSRFEIPQTNLPSS